MSASTELASLLQDGKTARNGRAATQALALVRRAPLYRPDLAMALADSARGANSADSVAYWDITEQHALAAAASGAWAVFDRLITQVRSRFASSWRADMVLGYAAEARGAWDKALRIYMRVVERDPLKSAAYKRQVAVLKAQRRVPEAIALLNYALRHFSCDADGWAELAALCLAEGRMEHALFAANEVLVHSAGGWAAHALVADVHMTIGGYQHFLSARRHYSASVSARRKGNLRALYGMWLAASALDKADNWKEPAYSEAQGGGDGNDDVGAADRKSDNERALAWACSAIHATYDKVEVAAAGTATGPDEETTKRKGDGRVSMGSVVRAALEN